MNNKVKTGMAKMLKSGVIMDVTSVEEAVIAEKSGAVAVMALEKIPSDIRKDGGVSRMSDPQMINEIKEAVSIPVMAKIRIGHDIEARVLESLEVDFIDESEVLTPANPFRHVDKHANKIPFVCGAKNLGEALRRISEGAVMIRTKGEAGTGNIIEAVRHREQINSDILDIINLSETELMNWCKEENVNIDIARETIIRKRLPVVDFAAGGIATPSDAALMMSLGSDGVFVGSGIFNSEDPSKTAVAIVKAVNSFNDYDVVAEVSTGLGELMKGLDIDELDIITQNRGH